MIKQEDLEFFISKAFVDLCEDGFRLYVNDKSYSIKSFIGSDSKYSLLTLTPNKSVNPIFEMNSHVQIKKILNQLSDREEECSRSVIQSEIRAGVKSFKADLETLRNKTISAYDQSN